MKSFRFTLEAVRILRQRQEQQAMEQYVRALLARQQALDRLESAEEDIRANQREMQRLLSSGFAAAQAHQVSVYQCALEKRRDERVAALGSAERRTQAAFQGMLQARRQRKIVETCREKQLARHQRAEAREEQKNLDDLASRRPGSLFSWNPTETLS